MVARTLICGMQSSGASLFACLLGQAPDSVVIVDLYSQAVAPSLQLPYPTIVKATVATGITLAEHVASFNPTFKILFLRNPLDVFVSLSPKRYRNHGGAINRKLRVQDELFARRHELFDLVVYYEDLVANPGGVVENLRWCGFDLPLDVLEFQRPPRAIFEFDIAHCSWCREHYLSKWGFGNVHRWRWGMFDQVSYPQPRPRIMRLVKAASPLLVDHYARSTFAACEPIHVTFNRNA